MRIFAGRIGTSLTVASEWTPHVSLADSSGRKHLVGSAIFDVRGTLCALARATWFEIEARDWT
ncbi:MAG: hypothetical protein ACREMQ_01635 [Longimicrobiales bacterium]